MNELAVRYVEIVLGYTCFVVLLSVFTINFAPLRIAEDLFLLALAGFACYTLVIDTRYYKEG